MKKLNELKRALTAVILTEFVKRHFIKLRTEFVKQLFIELRFKVKKAIEIHVACSRFQDSGSRKVVQ